MTQTTNKIVSYPFPQLGAQYTLDQYGDILKARDVAELVGVSPKTVIREIQRGILPGFRMGKSYFITKQKFLEFVSGSGGTK